MQGDVSESGGTITVPPFSFIQNGLYVEKDVQTSVASPSIAAPFFLTVTSANPTDTDNLSFQFAKAPHEITENEIIVAEYDGNEWRHLPFLSVDELLKAADQANIDFGKVGPTSGLLTTLNGANYDNAPGIVVDQAGLKTSLDEIQSFPVVATDPEWSRVDRLVYRRPNDSNERIGVRKLLVGGTYDAVPTGHDTQLYSNAAPHRRVKVLVSSDNTVHFIVAEGYGETFELKYSKYSSDRTTELVAPLVLTTAGSGEFDATIDSAGNIHLAYITPDKDAAWRKFSSVGASMAGPSVLNTGILPCDYPRLSASAVSEKIFIVFQVLVAASQNALHFASVDLSGATVTADKTIVSGASNYTQPSIAATDDSLLYIAYCDATLGRVYYQTFDDIGDSFATAVHVSGATNSGALVDVALDPQVHVSDNKVLFVLFRQSKGVQYGVTVWTDGVATLVDLVGAGEDIVAFDSEIDTILNEVHLIAATSARVDYIKLKEGAVVVSTQLSASGASYVALKKDRFGSMVEAWSSNIAATFTNIGAVQIHSHIGPVSVPGFINTLVLSADEFSFPATMTYVPNVGDRGTVSGSGSGNNGSYVVTRVELLSIDAADDTYRIQVTPSFPSVESPAAGSVQFATPDGNEARFIKSTSEANQASALSQEVLDSDILLARIYMPGSVILPYLPSGTSAVNSDLFGVYGSDVTIGWETPTLGELTITGGLKIVDLVNHLTYAPADDSLVMVEDDALYVVLDGSDLTPSYQVAPIALIPFGSPIQVLGFIKDGEFHPHLLSIGGASQLDSGEQGKVGEDLSSNIRTRLGITNDTTYEPYISNYYFALDASYPNAISILDATANSAAYEAAVSYRMREAKLIKGGTWSWDSGTGQLSFTSDAYIQLQEVPEIRNTLPVASSPITLDADGKVGYVGVNTTGVGASNIGVIVDDIENVVSDNSIIIIARRVGNDVLVGNGTIRLANGQSSQLDQQASDQTLALLGSGVTAATVLPDYAGRGAPLRTIQESHKILEALASIDGQIDKFFGQLRLTPHETDDDKVRVAGVDITLLDGVTLSQEFANLVLDFEGAVIDFTTGEVFAADGVTALGENFTPLTLADGEFAWYGVGLIPAAAQSDNTITALALVTAASAVGASANTAPKPAIAGDKKIGAVLVTKAAGLVEIEAIRQLGVGSGSGGTGGGEVVPEPADGFQAIAHDDLSEQPGSADSTIDSDLTTGSFDFASSIMELKCDKTKGASTTGAAFELSEAPTGFTLEIGNILHSGGAWRRVSAVSSAFEGTLDAAFDSDLAGETIEEISGGSGNIYASGALNRYGQTFTVGADDIVATEIGFEIYNAGAVTGDLVWELYATSGGDPTGAALASTGNINVSTLPVGPGTLTTASLLVPVKLTAGTTYAVVSRQGTTALSGNLTRRGSASDIFAGGNEISSTDSGSTWSQDPGDANFRVNSMATVMVAQAAWTVDLTAIGDAGQKTRLIDQFPNTENSVINLDYKDSLVVGDDVPDLVDEARVVVSASNIPSAISSQFTSPYARPAAPGEIPDYPLADVNPYPGSIVDDSTFYAALGTGFTATIIYDVVVQSDGKILVGGSISAFNGGTRFGLVRLNADLTDDTAFNANFVTGFNGSVEAIAVQADGKILVGGSFTDLNGNTRNKLVRLNSDGTEDAAFYTALGIAFNGTVNAIAVQVDGSIVVGGAFTNFNGDTRQRALRLSSTGVEDAAFYSGFSGFDLTVKEIAIQDDGKIIFVGAFAAWIERVNSDGTTDSAFTTALGTGFNGAITAVKLQDDGKILLGGSFTTLDGNTRNRLVRLNSDGTEDDAFYGNLGTGFGGSIETIVVQENERILVAGGFTTFNGATRNGIVKLDSDGVEDSDFASAIGTGFGSGSVQRLALTADGEVIAVGTFTTFNGNTRNYIARLLAELAKTALHLVFFPNPDNEDVTTQANLLGYEVSLYAEEVLLNGGFLFSAICLSDGSGTPVNCSAPVVVSGKTRVTLDEPYVIGINPGDPDGDLEVFIEGIKVPRYYTGVVGAYWREVTDDPYTIELDTDYSSLPYSIHVVRRQGSIDTADQNVAAIAALDARVTALEVARIVVEATTSVLQPISTGDDVIFGTKTRDATGALNAATGVFTAPRPDTYDISTALLSAAVLLPTNNRIAVEVVTSTRTRQLDRRPGSGASEPHGVGNSISLFLEAGETVKIRAYSEVATTLSGNATDNWLTITSKGGV